MRHKLFIVLLFLCQQYYLAAQDSCKQKLNVATSSNEGFSTDVRLDVFNESFIRGLDLQQYKFSNDYSGSLKNPGILFNDIDFSSYDLLSTNLSFSDKNNAQKITFSPFRLLNKADSSILFNTLLNTKINMALKNNITTFGIAIGGDYSDQNLKRNKRLRESIFSKGEYYTPECFGTKREQEIARQKNIKEAKGLLNEYDSIRTKHVFKWSAGYSVQLFAALSTKGDNLIADSVNFYGLKANVLSLSSSYGLKNGTLQFTGSYNHIFSRKSAEKGQNRILYHGLQFTSSYRIFSFLKGDKLKANENFIKSLFVPSLNIGIAYDFKTTKGETKFIEDGIQKSRVITPYIDILLTPASGFKIGFPFTKNKSVIDAKTLQLGAVIQYSFKLINLN